MKKMIKLVACCIGILAFIACGGNEDEALDDIISKKILRKLESQNPVLFP